MEKEDVIREVDGVLLNEFNLVSGLILQNSCLLFALCRHSTFAQQPCMRSILRVWAQGSTGLCHHMHPGSHAAML